MTLILVMLYVDWQYRDAIPGRAYLWGAISVFWDYVLVRTLSL